MDQVMMLVLGLPHRLDSIHQFLYKVPEQKLNSESKNFLPGQPNRIFDLACTSPAKPIKALVSVELRVASCVSWQSSIELQQAINAQVAQ